MTMEIKAGDKVRVRKDAPRVYFRGWKEAEEYEVYAVGGDAARIIHNCMELVIPLKYLVKVEDKANPKFKVNDVVRTVFNETTHITSVLENGNYYLYGMGNEYPEDSLTLIQPYTEPTEQTEAEKKLYDGISEETANEISDMLDAYVKALSGIADSFDWQRYEADLAKEVAVMLVKTHRNDLNKVAKMSVDIAKAVVEGFKRK